jgi:hypothetical protein
MGSFQRWAWAVGGALEVAGLHAFLNGTEEWLDDSDPDADAWTDHLAALHRAFGAGRFTAGDVASRVNVGDLELPFYRRDPGKSLAHTIGNMYRSIRGRWHGSYRLDSSANKDSPTGGRTWMVTLRELDGTRPYAEKRALPSQESQQPQSQPRHSAEAKQ